MNINDELKLSQSPNAEATNSGPQDKLAYDLNEIREHTALSLSTLYREINDGRLISRKCRRRRLVLQKDLVAWLENLPREVTHHG